MKKGCAVVTGASRGLGEGIALKLASEGYDLVMTYVSSTDKAKAVAGLITDNYGVRAELVQGDIGEYEVCKKIIDTAIEKFGKIDILVNNAGVAGREPFLETSVETIRKVINTDLLGTMYLCHLVIPFMKKEKYGRIVNTSSIASLMPVVDHVAYTASKSGCIGLTKGLAKELGEYNITVNAVAPGVIQTDIIDPEAAEGLRQITPLRKLGELEDIAECVWYIVNADFLTGQVISPNGGII